jgi:hypothetical protein
VIIAHSLLPSNQAAFRALPIKDLDFFLHKIKQNAIKPIVSLGNGPTQISIQPKK